MINESSFSFLSSCILCIFSLTSYSIYSPSSAVLNDFHHLHLLFVICFFFVIISILFFILHLSFIKFRFFILCDVCVCLCECVSSLARLVTKINHRFDAAMTVLLYVWNVFSLVHLFVCLFIFVCALLVNDVEWFHFYLTSL